MGLRRGCPRMTELKPRILLVASIAHVCNELGIPVVAEGIETSGEKEEALRAGCELLQGFLIGRPAPLDAAGLARHGAS